MVADDVMQLGAHAMLSLAQSTLSATMPEKTGQLTIHATQVRVATHWGPRHLQTRCDFQRRAPAAPFQERAPRRQVHCERCCRLT